MGTDPDPKAKPLDNRLPCCECPLLLPFRFSGLSNPGWSYSDFVCGFLRCANFFTSASLIA